MHYGEVFYPFQPKSFTSLAITRSIRLKSDYLNSILNFFSPAVLFFNIARRILGEIGVKDAVIFDEISKIKFNNPHEMVGKLKAWRVVSMKEVRRSSKRLFHHLHGKCLCSERRFR